MNSDWKLLRIGLGVVITLGTLSPTCSAFYFTGWPGSGVTPKPTLISPNQAASSILPSPLTPETIDPLNPLNPVTPIDPIDPPEIPTPSTPEPATAALALLGLGAVAAARRLRRSKK